MRNAVKAVKDGDFIPDRENDEITLALGNKEHDGRTRGTIGSQSWRTGFPEERKKYPDRSRQRRKDREEVEADSQKDRMCLIEERLSNNKMKLTHLKSKVLPAHLSSTLHSMLPAYRIIEKAVWLPPRSQGMTMTMMMVHRRWLLLAT